MIKIQKNIPLPGPATNQAKWKEILEKMVPGDSIVVKTYGEINAMRLRARLTDIMITSRKEGNGFRVWRVK